MAEKFPGGLVVRIRHCHYYGSGHCCGSVWYLAKEYLHAEDKAEKTKNKPKKPSKKKPTAEPHKHNVEQKKQKKPDAKEYTLCKSMYKAWGKKAKLSVVLRLWLLVGRRECQRLQEGAKMGLWDASKSYLLIWVAIIQCPLHENSTRYIYSWFVYFAVYYFSIYKCIKEFPLWCSRSKSD